jgi:hypothetical protein
VASNWKIRKKKRRKRPSNSRKRNKRLRNKLKVVSYHYLIEQESELESK